MSYPQPIAPQAQARIGEVFDGVLDAYRQDGFSAGYRRAISDVLSDFLWVSERFLKEHSPPPPGLRQVLQEFEQHLEDLAKPSSPAGGFVDGGLGI